MAEAPDDGIEIREDGVWVRLSFHEAGTLTSLVTTACDNMAALIDKGGINALSAREMLIQFIPLKEKFAALAKHFRAVVEGSETQQ